MRVDCEIVSGLDPGAILPREHAGSVTDVAGDIVCCDLAGANILEQLGLFGKPFPFGPRGSQRARSTNRRPFRRGHATKKVALANDLYDSWQPLQRSLINVLKFCS